MIEDRHDDRYFGQEPGTTPQAMRIVRSEAVTAVPLLRLFKSNEENPTDTINTQLRCYLTLSPSCRYSASES